MVGQGLASKAKSWPEIAASYIGQFAHYATFFSQAPVLVVALHKRPISMSALLLKGLRNPVLVSGEPLSVAMAVQNMLLAAQALELGTCVLTGPLIVQDDLTAALDLPAGYDFTCLVAIGYPAESQPPPGRKDLEHIAEFRNYADHRRAA
jgi:nitroreductase